MRANQIFRWSQVLILMALLSLLSLSCATPGNPDGGPRDETPPRLDTLFSTPNYQTNFTKQRLYFAFDEWVKLNNPITEVLVSPPFVNPLKFSIRKRTVRVDFPEAEALKENTTYTINFGDAIQDLTESNPVEDFRFVFSTGDEIDSLSLGGKVVDILTGEGVENVKVMLYYNRADSVVRTQKPYYFGKTDKDGNFQINNLPADTFKLFALDESQSDNNYIFNAANERIAFPDSLIVVTDSTQINLTLKLFAETLPLELQKDETEDYGLVKLRFNRPPYELEVGSDDSLEQLFHEIDGDTLKVWYDYGRNWRLWLRDELDFRDTIEVKPPPIEEFVTDGKLKWRRTQTGAKTSEVPPGEPIRLFFSHPVESFDTAGIQLFRDSLDKVIRPRVAIDDNPRVLRLSHSWKPEAKYELTIVPGAVKDWYGLTTDTISQRFTALAPKDLGVIQLTLTELDSSQAYALELLDKSNKLVADFQWTDQSAFKTTLRNLPPGEYSIKIIEDRNGNGRWDPGKYDLGLQPERRFEKKLDELRANWELEVEVSPVFQ